MNWNVFVKGASSPGLGLPASRRSKGNRRRLASHMTATACQQVRAGPLEPWLLEREALEGAPGYSSVRKKIRQGRVNPPQPLSQATDNSVVSINPQLCIDRLLRTCIVISATRRGGREPKDF